MTASKSGLWRQMTHQQGQALRSTARKHAVFSWRRVLANGSALAGLLLPALAHAQTTDEGGTPLLTSVDMAGYALVIGVVSAAVFSSILLIRQRNRLESENRDIRSTLSDNQQKISGYHAVIADNSRRIVMWDGQNGKAEFLGQLPADTGAPQSDNEFLALGRWLKPSSASELEKAIEALRSNAKTFDLVIETQRGEVIEVQGRLSGGRAFAHFVALNNLRAELAELKIERNRLRSSIATFESLLDTNEQPVRPRDGDGRLTWVNQAYC